MPIPSYVFETEPDPHQLTLLEETWDRPAFCIWWEQGTGKTKPMIDQFCMLYEAGLVGGLFIIAPDGVHRNWIEVEFRKHFPTRLRHLLAAMVYYTARAGNKGEQLKADKLVAHSGPAVLAMSYDAIMTDRGRDLAKRFLKSRPVFYVLDEGKRIKDPKSARAKRILASGTWAKYRRELDGTPVPNAPWDVYPQIKFVDPGFWKSHGLDDFQAMKQKFGVWEKAQVRLPGGRLHEYPKLIEYRDIEELNRIVQPITSRVTKDILKLPPKRYTPAPFEMTPRQRNAYQELARGCMAALGQDMVTAELAIVKMLRLQQITCGYVPLDVGDEELMALMEGQSVERKFHEFDPNPRADLLREICADLNKPAIIFARFRPDIDRIMQMMLDTKVEAVRYDGKVDDDGRALAVHRFQEAQDAQFFVGNPAVAGEGLTLTAAQTVIYYSNSFKLGERQQSEDRAHRRGQENSVNYIDLVASGTIDEYIRNALVEKHKVAALVTGDHLREWIGNAA